MPQHRTYPPISGTHPTTQTLRNIGEQPKRSRKGLRIDPQHLIRGTTHRRAPSLLPARAEKLEPSDTIHPKLTTNVVGNVVAV